MISKSLVGKYFILRQPIETGYVMLSRGRLIAKADEMYPIFLAEVWPQDDVPSALTSRSQILVTIDDLKTAYLFDDEAIWQEHFRDIVTQLERIRKDAMASRGAPKRRKAVPPEDPAPAPEAVQFVALDEDDMRKLLDRLKGNGAADDE